MSSGDGEQTQSDARHPSHGVGDRPQTTEATAMPDLSGTTLQDYRVIRLLGRGGMGEVYLAQQIRLNRSVALKVIHPNQASSPAALQRLKTEAMTAGQLNHPNIVTVYDLVQIDDLTFIVMEYIDGSNLGELLEKRGAVSIPVALKVMIQSLQAVHLAGQKGIVHRDIKPENLLLTRQGQVKVADFGLCLITDVPTSPRLTQEGVTLGTPMYMSPEQIKGRPLDHRSDLYSLGVTFYHLLTGSPPFQGDKALALALKHLQELPQPIRERRPEVPEDLAAIVDRLMAKVPEQRYATAGDALEDVVRVRQRLRSSESSASPTRSTEVDQTSITTDELADTPGHSSFLSIPKSFSDEDGGLTGQRLTRLGVLMVCSALVIGAGWGWTQRAPEITGRGATIVSEPPGLWIASWEGVPKQPIAQEQYRFAQRLPETVDQSAAWLAVIGHHPDRAHGVWHERAYVQLVRILQRRGDRERLRALADQMADQPNSTMRVAVIRAVVLELDGDLYDALSTLRTQQVAIGQVWAPLALEVIDRVRGKADGADLLVEELRDLEEVLREKLEPGLPRGTLFG